jgi:nucleoside-diphosphate-sugar epimerase
MARYIVTGGVGFIGYHLCVSLLQHGHTVIVFDNFANGSYSRKNRNFLRVKNCEVIKCDVRDKLPVISNIDGIFHLAALPRVQYSIENPIETNDVNVGGTLNVLEYAHKMKIPRVVFASSAAVYGDLQPPFIETGSVKPMSPYAIHKYTSELFLRLYSEIKNVDTASLRFFNVYGTNQDANHPYALLVPKVLGCIQQHTPVPVFGDGNNKRDYVFTDDVVNALQLAMSYKQKLQGQVFNIGSGKAYSVNEVLDVIAKHIGKPIDVDKRPARIEPAITLATISMAITVLGWHPTVTLDEGIRRCVNDVLSNV